MTDETPKREPLKPRPAHLATKGRRLWDKVTSTYVLRADELAVLEDACRERDLIERLETELRKGDSDELLAGGLMVRGSMGQLVANPLIAELRQHRACHRQLVAQLKLPDEEGTDGRAEAAAGDRSSSARHAANARWRRGA